MIDIQEVEQIWASLDKLAKTDPKGYVEYIKSMKKQEENSRVIQPGYSVRATSNDKSLHMINICQCKAVKPSPDNYNIPTLMSEKRTVVEDSKTIYVYDAVFHPSVLQNKAIEKDVLDLAVGCILELFSVTLMPESTSRTDGVYFGPYGWDDRTGKPLTTKEVEEQSLFGKHLFGPTELKEILTRAPEEVKDEIALELNLQPVTPSTKPMIEEIKSTSTTTLIDDFEPVVQMVTPKCTIKTFDERIEFHIYMPEIVREMGTSQKSAKSSRIIVDASEDDSHISRSDDDETGSESEAECAICLNDEDTHEKNVLVFCDGEDCNIAVHEQCYQIQKVPPGDEKWHCHRCEDNVKERICCPVGDGAFFRTNVPKKYIHVPCAWVNHNILIDKNMVTAVNVPDYELKNANVLELRN
ncbi:Bromodomain-containing protein 1 [Globomyces sp. JEL0801]|nr:Bromodomain-containing protein 1 [Globomyces sp. JEL0801]